MRRTVFFSLLLVSYFIGGPRSGAQSAQQPLFVSMLQLLTSPDKFDGKVVSVIGFLTIDHEGDRLFAHQEDAVHVILGSALEIQGTKQMLADREKIDMKYVKVLGTFQASDRRRTPFFSGAIVSVQSCEFWSDPKTPMSQVIRRQPGQGPPTR
jgi:hypothetical protein